MTPPIPFHPQSTNAVHRRPNMDIFHFKYIFKQHQLWAAFNSNSLIQLLFNYKRMLWHSGCSFNRYTSLDGMAHDLVDINIPNAGFISDGAVSKPSHEPQS